MFRRLAELIFILKWPLLLLLTLMTALTALSVLRLQIDPSMETLFIKDSPEYKYYREYRDKYGSDQIIALAMSTQDMFTLPHLKRLKILTDELAEFPQVERVMSLANVMDIKHRFFGIKIVPALGGAFKGKQTEQEVKEDLLRNELFVGNLISKDGKTASILIYLKPTGKDSSSSGAFIQSLRRYLHEQQTEEIRFYIAGSPVEQYDFIRLIRHDQFTFVPMITLLLVLTTLIIYRSFSCMVLSMSIVFMTICWTMGTIALLGQELNLMTSLLAPVIMIISVVNSIHLMNLFFEIRPHHPSLKTSVVLTMDQLGVPCFLTHFTTILGFISLAISPIPAIRSFGTFAALGTFYSYVVEILLTPILLPILPYRRVSSSFNEQRFFNRVIVGFLEKLEYRWKWLIIFLTVLAVFGSIVGIQKINVDTNIVKQMKPELPLAVATRFIDENLTGVYNMGFVLKKRHGEKVTDYETLMRLDRLKDYLESKDAITKVNSITTLVKKIHEARKGKREAYLIPEDPDRLAKYFKGIKEADDPEVWKLISRDFTEVRLEARIKAVGTQEGTAVEEDARQYIEENFSDDFTFNQTGNVVLLGRMAKDLVFQQMKSFSFAFGSIFILIIFIFRSIRLGFLAVIPTLLPILAVYGIMGWLGIELSSTTAMISSIVLGMVVDASIHFIHRFKIEYKKRYHYLQSLHHTFRNVGQALFVSTMILVAGFGSSVLANFKPTIYFGVFTSLTILLALVCTLIVLPVCLVMVKPFGSQKLFEHRKKRYIAPSLFRR